MTSEKSASHRSGNKKNELFGLVGEKLGHSYSRLIHESLNEYDYELFPMPEKELKDFIRKREFTGLNVTIPYKKTVMRFCDVLDPAAREIGAVNTLYFRSGKLHGANTDYTGFLYMASGAGISFAEKKVLILGSGGASLMAQYAVRSQHASQIYVASRSLKGTSGDITFVSYDHLPEDVRIIINATPAGMFPDNEGCPADLDDFPECRGVIDLIYNPFSTKLILQAKDRGIKCSGGFPMLVAQATAAAELFLDRRGLTERNEELVRDLRFSLENIILTGMPGCGKTTVGKIIAAKTQRDFVDLDEEAVKIAGKTIPDIFRQDGETAFRNIESRVCAAFGRKNSLVISTGGGTVLRERNMMYLRQNGRIFFLQRPADLLDTDGRPLSSDAETLEKMYSERLPLYRKYSDTDIKNCGLPEESAEMVISTVRS